MDDVLLKCFLNCNGGDQNILYMILSHLIILHLSPVIMIVCCHNLIIILLCEAEGGMEGVRLYSRRLTSDNDADELNHGGFLHGDDVDGDDDDCSRGRPPGPPERS